MISISINGVEYNPFGGHSSGSNSGSNINPLMDVDFEGTCCVTWGRLSKRSQQSIPITLDTDGLLAGKYPFKVSCGASHSIVMTIKGDLYSWGANTCGQLGHGDLDEHTAIQPIRKFSMLKAFCGDVPQHIATGKDYTLVLTRDGVVYSWGLGDQGQLGNMVDDEQALYLSKLNGGGLLLDVLLNTPTDPGACFPWNMISPFPKRISKLDGMVITQVACGSAHSMALTKDGQLFTWGSNSNGQLGLGIANSVNTHSPTKVKITSPLAMVAAGFCHSVALSSNNTTLYSWGKGSDGQLGLDSRTDESTPKELKPFLKQEDTVAMISCGHYHTCVLTSFKEVYTWGLAVSLGHTQYDCEDQLVPRLVTGLLGQNIESISCGFSHTLVQTNNGECMTFGQGEYGQLGLDKETGTLSPIIIPSLRPYFVDFISSGWWHSVAIISNRGTIKKSHSSLNFSSGMTKVDRSSNSIMLSDSMLHLEKLLIEYDVQQSLEMIQSFDDGLKEYEAMQGDLLAQQDDDDDDDDEPVNFKRKPVVHSLATLYDRFIKIFKEKPTNIETLDIDQDVLAKIWQNKFLPKWEKCIKSKEWRSIWRRGIPPDVRPIIWKLAIGNKLGITPAYYEEKIKIVELFLKTQSVMNVKMMDDFGSDSETSDEDANPHIPCFSELKATLSMLRIDLPRTFPQLNLFNRKGPFHTQLTHLLLAWTLHRPKIGYVQGMTYLGGLLCMHLEPYDCFVAFVNLVNTHFFTSLFMMDVQQIVKHVKIFDVLFNRHLPELHAAFRKMGFSSEHYLLEWFMTLFTKQLPLPVVARVWDCFLLEGESFIYRTAISVIKCCERLIGSSSFDDAIQLLRSMPQDIKEEALFSAITSMHVPKLFKRIVEKMNKEFWASSEAEAELSEDNEKWPTAMPSL
ncbi:hypothetical protein SAMD00019534_099090 [Acytostelium subglobosum LB1]|uniref:hypothetical protein n=1 Tax=Acytostelium subglobosum LB1 TaxID=1410327 RepID=UPI000644E384|nr:hypothetical protein SAMD00019534_099090 [Acytostelium subglobosum LB1]GAM26734.1 hypothetical protein SAMD00019534_099090 [Acytostelium subglobosum LB1]|eukprot:XP_012750395.1 hypothetical protein SAMD00019534_099090 [Acytostelium subglobosum LB1]